MLVCEQVLHKFLESKRGSHFIYAKGVRKILFGSLKSPESLRFKEQSMACKLSVQI